MDCAKNQTFVNKNFAWSNPGAVGGLMQTNSNTLFNRERFYREQRISYGVGKSRFPDV